MRTPLALLAFLALGACAGPAAVPSEADAPDATPPAAPPPASPTPPEPAPAPAAPAFDHRAILTEPGRLDAYLAEGGSADDHNLLLWATANLDGAVREDALRRLLAAGADANASLALIFAARACAPDAAAMLLDAGADPHMCLERRGSCLREGALDAVVYGRFPYLYAEQKLERMAEGDPERPACQATADLLRPVTRVY